jgi:hypothetical protein
MPQVSNSQVSNGQPHTAQSNPRSRRSDFGIAAIRTSGGEIWRRHNILTVVSMAMTTMPRLQVTFYRHRTRPGVSAPWLLCVGAKRSAGFGERRCHRPPAAKTEALTRSRDPPSISGLIGVSSRRPGGFHERLLGCACSGGCGKSFARCGFGKGRHPAPVHVSCGGITPRPIPCPWSVGEQSLGRLRPWTLPRSRDTKVPGPGRCQKLKIAILSACSE